MTLVMIFYVNLSRIKTLKTTQYHELFIYILMIVCIVSDLILVHNNSQDDLPFLRLLFSVTLFFAWNRLFFYLKGSQRLGLMIRMLV